MKTQYGFRKGMRTTEAVNLVQCMISKAKSDKTDLFLCFIDLEKVGLKQGCNMSLLLFNIMIFELATAITLSGLGVNIGGDIVGSVMLLRKQRNT